MVEGVDSSATSIGLLIIHALPTLIGLRVRVFTTQLLVILPRDESSLYPWFLSMAIPHIDLYEKHLL